MIPSILMLDRQTSSSLADVLGYYSVLDDDTSSMILLTSCLTFLGGLRSSILTWNVDWNSKLFVRAGRISLQ